MRPLFPFRPLGEFKTSTGKALEVVWTNGDA